MMPERGSIALVSQSGALGGTLIYSTRMKRIGMSKFASLGNASDVGLDEVFGYFTQDVETRVIAAYVESVKDARKLFTALQKASSKKPVVVLKGGKSEAGGLATRSHTGSFAGSPELFDGMLRQAGCISAPTLDSLLEIAKIFDYQPLPKGRKIGIITNTGGAGVLAADALSELGLQVPRLTPDTQNELKRFLSPLASVENPVDIVASGGRQEYRVASELMLRDTSVDTLFVICAVPTFAGMTQTEHAVGMLEGLQSTSIQKPVVGVWLAGDVGKSGKDLLETNRVPCYDDPYTAALCISRATQYAEARARRGKM
jgi:acyl-CoA synthetase (NDP forming)